MSYSINPEVDASRHLDAEYETAHDRKQSELRLAMRFIQCVMNKPMDAPCDLDERHVYHGDGKPTKRPATVGEVAFDAFDYANGPTFDELLALLVRVAKAGDAEAADIIGRAASAFAYYRT